MIHLGCQLRQYLLVHQLLPAPPKSPLLRYHFFTKFDWNIYWKYVHMNNTASRQFSHAERDGQYGHSQHRLSHDQSNLVEYGGNVYIDQLKECIVIQLVTETMKAVGEMEAGVVTHGMFDEVEVGNAATVVSVD
jgi:hypothetical protein